MTHLLHRNRRHEVVDDQDWPIAELGPEEELVEAIEAIEARDVFGHVDLSIEQASQILELAAAEAPTVTPDGKIRNFTVAGECRICGCTNERGCAGGCIWVEPNLCSRCAR
jgi:hypothetical protein